MNKNYTDSLGNSKDSFHKKRAKMTYEEKFRIIIELQKINAEMMKGNKRKTRNKLYTVWQLPQGIIKP